MLVCSRVHVTVVATDCLICHAGSSEVEKTLMKNLFNGYNLKVRPAARPEERVVVRVGMVLSSFVGLVRNSFFPVGWETFFHRPTGQDLDLIRQNVSKLPARRDFSGTELTTTLAPSC